MSNNWFNAHNDPEMIARTIMLLRYFVDLQRRLEADWRLLQEIDTVIAEDGYRD